MCASGQPALRWDWSCAGFSSSGLRMLVDTSRPLYIGYIPSCNMDRPVRMKKTVDYSQFGDLDNDDEDFACSSAPPSKKLRVESKKEKKEKPVKKPQKEGSISQLSSQGKRTPLDDKLYQRDLEAALVLSALDTTAIVGSIEDQVIKVSPTFSDDITIHAEVPFSNCSVDGSTLGLEEISNCKEEQVEGRSRRQAASKAITEQRKLLADNSDNEDAEDEFKPDLADSDGSESDSSFSGEDEEFDVQKSSKLKAAKGTKQTSMKKNHKACKAVPKAKTAASSASYPASIKVKSLPSHKAPVTSPATVKPKVCHSSPPIEVGKKKWTPPAPASGSRDSLGGGAVRSPNQGLRLGLSRFARVKPLHPAIVNH